MESEPRARRGRILLFSPLVPDPSPDADHAARLAAELRAAGRPPVLVRASRIGIGAHHPDFAEEGALEDLSAILADQPPERAFVYREAVFWPEAPRHWRARLGAFRAILAAADETHLVLAAGWRRQPAQLLAAFTLWLLARLSGAQLRIAAMDTPVHVLAGHRRAHAQREQMAVALDLDHLHDVALHADLVGIRWIDAMRRGLSVRAPETAWSAEPGRPEGGEVLRRRPPMGTERLGAVFGTILALAGRPAEDGDAEGFPPEIEGWFALPVGGQEGLVTRMEYLVALVAQPGHLSALAPWRDPGLADWFRRSVIPAAPALARFAGPSRLDAPGVGMTDTVTLR